jgi:hypothetical protein
MIVALNGWEMKMAPRSEGTVEVLDAAEERRVAVLFLPGKTMKQTINLLFASVLIAVWAVGFAPMAVAASDSPAYYAYTFNKPPMFDNLEAFVKETYNDDLDQSTLTLITIDSKPAVTFWTDAVGVRNFHLLIQDDSTLVLFTTAKLDITPDEFPAVAGSRESSNTLRPLSVVIGPIYNACTTSANASNCVKYVRCLAPWLPSIDLTTFVAKKSLINSSVPVVGAVAVIQVSGQFAINGHLAYVTAVNRDARGQISTITISESHYVYTAGFDMRTDAPQSLHVVGYIVRK